MPESTANLLYKTTLLSIYFLASTEFIVYIVKFWLFQNSSLKVFSVSSHIFVCSHSEWKLGFISWRTSAAMIDFNFPTSFFLNKDSLLNLDISILSLSFLQQI